MAGFFAIHGVLWKLSVIFENKVAFVDFGIVNMWFNITQI
jgi:hypothetical protein